MRLAIVAILATATVLVTNPASATYCEAQLSGDAEQPLLSGSIDNPAAMYAIVQPEPDSFLQIFQLRQDPIAQPEDGSDESIPAPIISWFMGKAEFDILAGQVFEVIFVDARGATLCSEVVGLILPPRRAPLLGERTRLTDTVNSNQDADSARVSDRSILALPADNPLRVP